MGVFPHYSNPTNDRQVMYHMFLFSYVSAWFFSGERLPFPAWPPDLLPETTNDSAARISPWSHGTIDGNWVELWCQNIQNPLQDRPSLFTDHTPILHLEARPGKSAWSTPQLHWCWDVFIRTVCGAIWVMRVNMRAILSCSSQVLDTTQSQHNHSSNSYDHSLGCSILHLGGYGIPKYSKVRISQGT